MQARGRLGTEDPGEELNGVLMLMMRTVYPALMVLASEAWVE